jgi:hypothetical protein
MMTGTYRNWRIDHDPRALHPSYVWQATSPDYDADCDQDGYFVCSGMYACAATREELLAEIDAKIEDAA